MSHDFKFKIDELRDNNPSKEQITTNYETESSVRNVCFVQSDGKMIFLNYAYLISGEYLTEESTIILYFTSHTITLRGTKIELLFQQFFNHTPKTIINELERFKGLDDNDTFYIASISIEKK